jgi:hypothetical protein
MAFVLGLNAKLYRNTGSYAVPVWDLVTNVRDLRLNLEKGEADVTTRGGNGWEQVVATLKSATIEWGMLWDTGDTDFTVIRDSFLNDSTVEFLVLDGLVGTTGSQGLRAICMVNRFTRNENLREALTVDVAAKPTYSANAPSWFTVA